MGMVPGVHARVPQWTRLHSSSWSAVPAFPGCWAGEGRRMLPFRVQSHRPMLLSRMYPHRIVSAASVAPEHEDQPAHRARGLCELTAESKPSRGDLFVAAGWRHGAGPPPSRRTPLASGHVAEQLPNA
ncbi:hypothetical protein VTN00DRAFT_4954 [Thermoascus crustaceus]|uniref:uncharacterized protein n=1 Tax=Thermoascus crustaceus TaxID=5088 RepID=UPI0037438728